MQTQWIPAIGLAATIALSGYMAIKLGAESDKVSPSTNASAPAKR